MTDYKTYWLVGGQEYIEFAEVEKLVECGAVAEEITADEQRSQAERRAALEAEAEHERLQAEYEAAARAYSRSPEGRREAVLRDAETNPGGRVTLAGDTNAFDELRSWSKDADPLVGRWD